MFASLDVWFLSVVGRSSWRGGTVLSFNGCPSSGLSRQIKDRVYRRGSGSIGNGWEYFPYKGHRRDERKERNSRRECNTVQCRRRSNRKGVSHLSLESSFVPLSFKWEKPSLCMRSDHFPNDTFHMPGFLGQDMASWGDAVIQAYAVLSYSWFLGTIKSRMCQWWSIILVWMQRPETENFIFVLRYSVSSFSIWTVPTVRIIP
jgi:hypothetical protein